MIFFDWWLFGILFVFFSSLLSANPDKSCVCIDNEKISLTGSSSSKIDTSQISSIILPNTFNDNTKSIKQTHTHTPIVVNYFLFVVLVLCLLHNKFRKIETTFHEDFSSFLLRNTHSFWYQVSISNICDHCFASLDDI